jgi:hypothetical protein
MTREASDKENAPEDPKPIGAARNVVPIKTIAVHEADGSTLDIDLGMTVEKFFTLQRDRAVQELRESAARCGLCEDFSAPVQA